MVPNLTLKSFGEQTQVDSRVWAAASDSVLSGSPSHMATCQQAGGGNIIPGRKAAAISACTPPRQSAQGGGRKRSRRSRRSRRRRGRTCTKSALSHRSRLPLFVFHAFSAAAAASSGLPYHVCGGFSAVSTERY